METLDHFDPEKPEITTSSDHRRHGRLRCNSLTCTLGQILDMSGSGMRVYTKKKPSNTVNDITMITINTMPKSLDVKIRIVWIHHVGFRKYELGLEYEDLTQGTRSAICAIARAAAKREADSSRITG